MAVSVYRLKGVGLASPRALPPEPTHLAALQTAANSRGSRIAVWQTGVAGLNWLDALVAREQAIEVRGRGYPNHYFAPARNLLTQILEGPPEAKAVWGHDAGDILGPNWAGQTSIDRAAAAECSPDEWLLVEAWDES